MCKVLCKSVKLPGRSWSWTSRFAKFREFAEKKTEAEMGFTYITRLNTIQGTRGYKVFECALKYMRVIRQNTLSCIIAPPSGTNSQ